MHNIIKLFDDDASELDSLFKMTSLNFTTTAYKVKCYIQKVIWYIYIYIPIYI